MTLTVREVYEWHMENARECIGRSDLKDVNGNPLDVEMLKAQLMEDFKQDKIRKSIDQIELMAEIYGTGIGEIVVKTEKIFEPATQPIPGETGQAAIGVVEKNKRK